MNPELKKEQLVLMKPEKPYHLGLRDIAIGFVFLMLSFKLNNFDVFVDFVGYLLISIGLRRLMPFSTNFSRASRSNNALLFLSIFKIVIVKIKLTNSITLHAPFFVILFGSELNLSLILFLVLVLGVIQFLFEWHFYLHFFRGLIDIALLNKATKFALKASTMWGWMRAWLLSTFLILIPFLFPALTLLILIPLLAFNVILLIGLLVLCYRFGHLPVYKTGQDNEQV